MRGWVWLLALAVASGVRSDRIGYATPETGSRGVRVLTSHAGERLVVRGTGAWECCADGSAPLIDTLARNVDLTLTARHGQVEWRPTPDATTRRAPSAYLVPQLETELAVTAGSVTRRFLRPVVVYPEGNTLRVVEEVPLEEYVEASLSAEASPQFHPEALKAMAVAVRSYALRSGPKHSPWADVCEGSHCQNYAAARPAAAAIRTAVAATAGLVARYDGAIIEAIYSADCGGHTEASENAWAGRALPYLRAFPDWPEAKGEPYCAIDPRHAWSWLIPAERLRRLAGLHANQIPVVEIVETTASDRVKRLRIVASDGTGGKSFTGEEFREAVGVNGVRSLRFTVRQEANGDATLLGTGSGHGVGLCQWGAHGYASSERSPTFEQILRRYYPGTTVEPLAELSRQRSPFEPGGPMPPRALLFRQ